MRKLLALAAVLLATTAVAADKSTESAIRGSGVYGTAGCGLGSMAFGNTPGMIQVLAATTNGFFGTQTFGITTGTSNCGKGAMALNGTKVFIEGNKEALAKDAARGSGETLVTLSYIAQCKDTAQVSAALQKNYGALFPAADVSTEQVRDNVISLLKSDKALGCNLG
jgi:hypothetical protein